MPDLQYPVSFFSAPAEGEADLDRVTALSERIGEWNQARWTTR